MIVENKQTDNKQRARPMILVVDDELMICKVLCEFLDLEGYSVAFCTSGEEALEVLNEKSYDVLITDLKMKGMSGLELLGKIKNADSRIISIVMTGYGTVDTAIQSMKSGAFDYILKPFKMDEVIQTIERGLDERLMTLSDIGASEARSIYRVSEAMTSLVDIDSILDVISAAVIDESAADVVSIHLKDLKSGSFVERVRKTSDLELDVGLPCPDHQKLLSVFEQQDSVLIHGYSTYSYFSDEKVSSRLQSFISLPLSVAGKTIGHLNAFSFTENKHFQTHMKNILRVLASRAASAIENIQLYDDLQVKNKVLISTEELLQDNYQKTIVGFARALEESDLYTRGHSERVSIFAGLTAEGLELPKNEVRDVVRAGLMHDIGKLGIRYEMLNKPGPLNNEEKLLFREHPEKGKRILEPIPCMKNIVDAAWCHHEFYNGGGYPRGISGDQIPLIGRIVQVADAYDAMTSNRAYRKALSHEIAVNELRRCSGQQFDPRIVETFVRVVEAYRFSKLTLSPDIELSLLESIGEEERSVFVA